MRSESDLLVHRQNDEMRNFYKLEKESNKLLNDNQLLSLINLNNDNIYSIFMSCIEINKNSIYDLFENLNSLNNNDYR
jgi:hypothetical protein